MWLNLNFRIRMRIKLYWIRIRRRNEWLDPLCCPGWFSVSLDRHLQATISHVKFQLARLWHPDTIRLLTSYLQV